MKDTHKSESPEAATSGDSEPTLTKKIGDSIMTQATDKIVTVARSAELLARELHDQALHLPDTTALWPVVDLTAAAAHLRAAARLIDQAADRITADDPCAGSGKVTVSTGRWNYTAPCPACHPEEFATREVDSDHVIIGPAVTR